jgi:multidrug resistance efflux pump
MAKSMTPSPAENQALAEMKELQKRYEGLSRKKVESETNLKNARKSLKELQDQALEKYGTHEIESLEQKLAEMKTENERMVREYQASLDKIDADLKQVDDTYQSQVRD